MRVVAITAANLALGRATTYPKAKLSSCCPYLFIAARPSISITRKRSIGLRAPLLSTMLRSFIGRLEVVEGRAVYLVLRA